MKFPNSLKSWRLRNGKTQEELAKVLANLGDTNANKQKIWKIEAGNQRMRPEEALAFARALNCTVEDILAAPSLSRADDSHFTQEGNGKAYGLSSAPYSGKAFKTDPALIPVYGPAAASSDDVVMLTDEHIIAYEQCPPALQNVRGAFMMYVAGSSMEPRHYHGERVWVDPWTKPAIGQDCVVVLEEHGNAIVKRYMGREGTDFVFEQYNPPKKLKFKTKEIRAIYAVTR